MTTKERHLGTAALVPIEDAELSLKTHNCLRGAKIKYLNELIDMPLEKMRRIRNLGSTGIDQVGRQLIQWFGVERPELLKKKGA